MKNNLIILFLLFQSITLLGQEKESLFFLETDSTWIKEIFVFPLRFAQEISYEGTEDARFPEGWSKKESPYFWSYAFAWNISLTEELTEKELEDDLKIYFNGLMSKQNTTVKFVKRDDENDTSIYLGKVHTFDSFFTKKPMTLNVKAESFYSEKSKKTVILFRFSPQEFENIVWGKLEDVKVSANICDL